MSVADAGKFFDIASHDPDILRRLAEGPATLPDVLGRVVSEANLVGITLTAEDTQDWISAQQPDSASAPATAVPVRRVQNKEMRPAPVNIVLQTVSPVKNTEPLVPPTDSVPHFLSWLAGQVPPSTRGHAGRRI